MMKFNKIFIAFFIIATTFMVSCKKYEDTYEPAVAVSADNPAVRFSDVNPLVYELKAEDLSIKLTVIRDSSSTSAIEVPVTLVSDTSNVFSIPEKVSFPAGETTVELVVKIDPAAPKGVDYGFEIDIDEQYTNSYKIEYTKFFGKASISPWVVIGQAQFYDSFSFYKVAEVTMWQNDLEKTQYRISDPYSEGILTDAEWGDWIGGPTNDKIYFTIANDTSVTWKDSWYIHCMYKANEGDDIKAYFPSVIDKEGDDLSVVKKDKNGKIIYFELQPYFYVDGVGGWGLYPVYLALPGFDLAGALGLEIYSGTKNTGSLLPEYTATKSAVSPMKQRGNFVNMKNVKK